MSGTRSNGRWQFVRPRRLSVGEVGYEPAYETDELDGAGAIRMRCTPSRSSTSRRRHRPPGALLLYDEAHLLADDRARERFPLSSLLAAPRARTAIVEPRVRGPPVGLPTLSLNLKRARTYAERMFRHVVVGNLERGDAWDALGIPLAGSERSFELSLDRRDRRANRRLPVLPAVLRRLPVQPRRSIGRRLEDYLALESALLHELDLAFFEDRYLVAGTAGQRVLEAMARAGGRVSTMSLRRALGDLPNVDVVVRRLVDRGLIYRPTRGTYDFALPLFGSYLRRRAELTQLTGWR